MTSSLKDQTILISGATSGIGRITARELARMGAQVVIIGRNADKAKSVAAEIQSATGNPRVANLVGDLSSLAEVRRLAEEFLQRFDRLNVLINNAGGVFFHRRVSVDGFEMTLALNHLSPFLLTNLLLDRLAASQPARVITVSSAAHWSARIDPDNLDGKRIYRGWRAYSQTKLMNILFTHELARRMGEGITANCLHPGFVATNFGKSNGGIIKWMWSLGTISAISPEKGAETSIYLASSPEAGGITGEYFVDGHIERSSPASNDPETARRLWETSLRLTGLNERLNLSS
jgi:NAD(P)-dependent dehydrogenase (short-subunit alcohol dehydrogenase family)